MKHGIRPTESISLPADGNRVIDLKTEHIGPDEVLVAGKIEFDHIMSGTEISSAVDEIGQAVRASVPLSMRIPDVYRST